MATVKNFGILEGIDWNSHNWQYHSSEEDIKKSKFGYVTENSKTHTSLNFGHDIYPADEKGYYPGLLPHLWSRGLDRDNSKFVCCIFMKSRNYKDGNIYIIGMYAFPEFIKSSRKSPIAGDDFIFQSNVFYKSVTIVN
ncbi:MAG: hypothetical protein EOO85_20220 [Pedobacter sp.]|nr:MAG: hypothetical protein EOO85_20220 [Pedobacter sp.]